MRKWRLVITINVKKHIDYAYSDEDGETVYELIKNELTRGLKVNVDMEGIQAVTSNFIYSAFVQLLDDFTLEFIQENLHFVNSNKTMNENIKRAFYFNGELQ